MLENTDDILNVSTVVEEISVGVQFFENGIEVGTVDNVIIQDISEVAVTSVAENQVLSEQCVVALTLNGGEGDMMKAVYDSDNDHIVDNSHNALNLGGTPAESFLKETDIIDCGTF